MPGTTDDIVSRIGLLPVMSTTATRILKLLGTLESDPAQLERLVRLDPGLTADVLKYANSAYFGFHHRIGSLRYAFVVLGWRRLFRMVAVATVNKVLGKALAAYDLAAGDLWRHSVAASVIADRLTQASTGLEHEQAFTVALCHDVGKIVLADLAASSLSPLSIAAPAGGAGVCVAEQEAFGIDHAEVGALVLGTWALPGSLVSAVRWHHEPEHVPSPNVLADVVHVADHLSHALAGDLEEQDSPTSRTADAMERLGIDSVRAAALVLGVREEIDEIGEALSADADPGTAPSRV